MGSRDGRLAGPGSWDSMHKPVMQAQACEMCAYQVKVNQAFFSGSSLWHVLRASILQGLSRVEAHGRTRRKAEFRLLS